MKLEGQVAFVLGGARGIGKGYCESLLKRKVKVCCADLLEQVGRETETELRQKYGAENFIFRVCNGKESAQIKDCMKFTKEHFGRLDIVINNVGIMGEVDWKLTLELNIGTTCRITEATLEMLGKDRGGPGGVLIHTASNGGVTPQFYSPVYCATKTAMIQYVRAWAHKFNYENHGIRMFTMCPMMTNTPFVQENSAPGKALHMELMLSLVEKVKQGFMLSPDDVGEAMATTLEDETLNGVAVQMSSATPEILFKDQNAEVSVQKCYKSQETVKQ